MTAKIRENPNQYIVDQFDQLIDLIKMEQLVDGDKKHIFRLRNIKKAREHISSMDQPIKLASQLSSIPGIGSGILRRVTEILKTGTLSELDLESSLELKQKYSGLNSLLKLHGLGMSKVGQLLRKGINDIDTLKQLNPGELNKLIPVASQVALKYYDHLVQRLPREFITEVNKYLTEHIPNQYQFIICGSYRRGRRTSGDIDILIKHRDPTNKSWPLRGLCDELKAQGFLVARLSGDHKKYNGICHYDGRYCRIDFLWTTQEQFYPALLHFTGSQLFNIKIRCHANKKGYKLSNLGLSVRLTGQTIHADSERDIFDILEYPYVEPDSR